MWQSTRTLFISAFGSCNYPKGLLSSNIHMIKWTFNWPTEQNSIENTLQQNTIGKSRNTSTAINEGYCQLHSVFVLGVVCTDKITFLDLSGFRFHKLWPSICTSVWVSNYFSNEINLTCPTKLIETQWQIRQQEQLCEHTNTKLPLAATVCGNFTLSCLKGRPKPLLHYSSWTNF